MRRAGILFFILVLLSSVTKAQDGLYLSLDSARSYALAYNKVLKTSGYSIDKAQEKLKETIANGLPQVDATVDYSNFFGVSTEIAFSENMPAQKLTFNPTSNMNLKVGQLIFSGSYLVGIKMSKLYAEMASTNYEKSELNIEEQVNQSYYLVLVSENLLKIIQNNLENVHEVYDKTKVAVSAGILEQIDLDQISIQVAMLENSLKSTERQVEMAYNMLRLNLGVAADTEIHLTDKLDDILKRVDFESAIADPFDIGRNIDYQLVKQQEEISSKQVDMEKMSYLPSVTGFYNYTYKILKPNFDISPKHVIGLNVSIPIFSSGVRKHKLSQARIDYESAKTNREYVSEQLKIQESQLRFNLKNALEKYRSQKENVDVSKRVYENMKMKYEQGLVSSLDLTTSNNNYLQAESQYVSSLLQLLEAHTALEKLINNL